MKQLVIFDLDGTLLDTIDDLAVSSNYALHQYHFPEHTLQEYRYFVGNGITKLIERTLPADSRQPEIIVKLRETFVTYYQQHKTDLTRPYPGIPELLAQLKEEGLLLAVASNKYHQGTVELIHHYFGKEVFTIVLGQRENIAVKPHPAIVEEILQKTGISKSQTLYVGDSGVDMQTAHNSGVISAGVTWGFRPLAELEENGACHIVNHPEELLPLVR